jgi:hypothetical protein
MQRTDTPGSVTWTVPGGIAPSCTILPATLNRIFVFRNAILMMWLSAGVSALNSCVRSRQACHRVATTFDADNDIVED